MTQPEGDKNIGQPQDQKTEDKGNNAEELLKSLNLTPEQIEKLKTDTAILNLVTHNLDQKRAANEEAKKYRLELEKITREQEARKEKELEEKGQFESLYKETQEKLKQKEEQVKQALINGEVKSLAAKYGIKKSEYLKLYDTKNLVVDEDMNVIGAEESFKEFASANPELFGDTVLKPQIDNGKPNIGNMKIDDDIDKLKKIAEQSKKPSDIARYMAALRAKNKK